MVGPFEGDIRRAIPGQIIKISRAAGVLVAADFQANLGNWGAVGILKLPGKVVGLAWL